MTIHSWWFLSSSVCVFATSCFCPPIASRLSNSYKKGLVAASDAFLTLVSFGLGAAAFRSLFWGLCITIFVYWICSRAFSLVISPGYDPYGLAARRREREAIKQEWAK